MKTYARIENGIVAEIILPAEDESGAEIDISVRYTPEFVAELVEVTEATGSAAQGQVYADGKFADPVIEPPSNEELSAAALAHRDSLLRIAALRIAPLQDADDLGISTTEEQASLTAWKKYRVALNRIEQQAGYPASITWPDEPA
ncbi:tail fiber assembly protein [Bradyrhizobium sp.]|uniref:tail fiber assembly protein n=1 Tax=Bradyrhizobium sp. TaxID=376 RepID=UPI0039E4277F